MSLRFDDLDDDDEDSELYGGSRENLYTLTVDNSRSPGRRGKSPESRNKFLLVVAFFSFFLFAVAEMLGGVFGNSLSLIEDASTMLVDAFTYIFNYFAEVKKRGAPRRKVLQLEIFSPLFSVVALLLTTGYITYQAVQELFPEEPCSHIPMRGLDCGRPNSTAFDLVLANLTVADWDSCQSTCEDNQYGTCRSWQFYNSTASCRLWQEGMCTESATPDPDVTSGSCAAPEPEVSIAALWIFSSINLVLDFVNLGTFCMNSKRKKRLAKASQTSDTETNANMMSAFTHIVIDTLRSLAVMVAALAAGVFGYDSDKTDAVCAIAVTVITLISTAPLIVVLKKKIGELRRLSSGGGRYAQVPQLTGLDLMDIEIGEL